MTEHSNLESTEHEEGKKLRGRHKNSDESSPNGIVQAWMVDGKSLPRTATLIHMVGIVQFVFQFRSI